MKNQGLLIVDGDDNPIDSVLSNEKSRAKSVEQGELWIVDPSTLRVLPYRGGGVTCNGSFENRGSWYVISIDDTTKVTVRPNRETPGRGPTPVSGEAHPTEAPPGETPGTQHVLTTLTKVIRDRHAEMPEGSYTTHLFSKGIEKIRKKTGEEAVELILAQDSTEIASEAADLLYHTMVLLEAVDLSIDDVLAVLEERHNLG